MKPEADRSYDGGMISRASLLWLSLLGAVLVGSCDSGGDPKTAPGEVDFSDPTASYTASLLIYDRLGAPVEGATVHLGDTEAVSDDAGEVSIEGVLAGRGVAVQVEADSFLPQTVLLSYSNAGNSAQSVYLWPGAVTTLDGALGGQAVGGLSTVNLEPGSITTADGTVYDGPVQVNVSEFDPIAELFGGDFDGENITSFAATFNPDVIPAGALMAADADGNVTFSPPEVVVQVELTTDTGEELRLNPEIGSTVRLALPDMTQKQLGDVVPLMSFDAEKGLWQASGECTVQSVASADGASGGDDGAPQPLECVGKVRHFSPVSVSGGVAGATRCAGVSFNSTGNGGAGAPRYWIQESYTDPNVAGAKFVAGKDVWTVSGTQVAYLGVAPWIRLMADNQTGTPATGLQFKAYAGAWTSVAEVRLTASDISALRAQPSKAFASSLSSGAQCRSVAGGTIAWDRLAGTTDADGDGFAAAGDCNDSDRSVYPNAPENQMCPNKDFNCDGTPTAMPSPSDWSPSVWNATCAQINARRPGYDCLTLGAETPGNAYDENCDGVISDADGDGFFAPSDPAFSAAAAGNSSLRSDCRDDDARVPREPLEVPGNNVDEDCDGVALDQDGDGYLLPSQASITLNLSLFPKITDESKRFMDCNDANARANPAGRVSDEAVFGSYFVRSNTSSDISMNGAVCSYFDSATGALTAAGRRELFDANCDGVYSDVDGDGFTLPGDNALGMGKATDCNDGDPLHVGSSGVCRRTVSASLACAPLIDPLADADGDLVADALDRCPGYDDRVNTDGDSRPNGCDGCPMDVAKLSAGVCGCGIADTNTDGDMSADCTDECDNDSSKEVAGLCGCGVAEVDSDADGTPDCTDGCPSDASKTAAGVCGCGVVETDTDADGTPNCTDACPDDAAKLAAGLCGCGVAETDTDADSTPDCTDECDSDPTKVAAGLCGCGIADTDVDADGTADCTDGCPSDASKTSPGECGCGVAEGDSDEDGSADCNDACPSDGFKTEPGSCGCGVAEDDTDGDETPDCSDGCVSDAAKIAAGVCGCGVADADSDADDVADCQDQCSADPLKTDPGICGCGSADSDVDLDGTFDCDDACPTDAGKTAAGACGCGVADTDGDFDGTPDCTDGCSEDAGKTAPGACGCGVEDVDSDSDGVMDCMDACADDPDKSTVGICGCGIADTDTDSDATPDCNDFCASDPAKIDPGECGCGASDEAGDTDGDGTPNCDDLCAADPGKIEPGSCGCGVADSDTDLDGTLDCDDECPMTPGVVTSSTYYQDADSDTYGNVAATIQGCTAPTGYVSDATDCNDGASSVRPGGTETCNSTDDNCNGSVDEGVGATYYRDVDGDTYGNVAVTTVACSAPSGYVSNSTDCNDASASVRPGASETCNGVDDNCSGVVDEGVQSTFYRDADGDTYGLLSSTTLGCTAPSGYVSDSTDCNDSSAAIRPTASETCNGVDDNCSGAIDEGVLLTYYQDADGDTYGLLSSSSQACSAPSGYVSDATDCDDASAAIRPGATEICNSIDDNCSGVIDEDAGSLYYRDADGDAYGDPTNTMRSCSVPSGYVSNSADCNDASASVRPGAAETCNEVDDNCSGVVDEDVQSTFYRDADGDAYGLLSSTVLACVAPSGYVSNSTDCNDGSAAIRPSASEICNGVDDNCSGAVDEGVLTTYYRDLDADTYGNALSATTACTAPSGYVASNTDCDDSSASVSPGATEVCNDVDDNCSGATDEGVLLTYYRDQDSDTWGTASTTTTACSAPSGYVSSSTDCNDSSAAVNPSATETCNDVDDNCNGSTDEGVGFSYYRDLDMDSYGDPAAPTTACSAPLGYVADDSDCNDEDYMVNPGDSEWCNGYDDNCDGEIDELVQLTFYADSDGDYYGDPAVTIQGCFAPEGYTYIADDCDDGDELSFPGASEICSDRADNDCDALTDYNDVESCTPPSGCTVVSTVAGEYLYCSNTLSWTAASDYCPEGYDLARVTSAEEDDALYAAVSTLAPFVYEYAIGVNDQSVEGDYRFEDGGSVSFTDWATGEPNDAGGNEDCAGVYGPGNPTTGNRGLWNDYQCTQAMAFVCEAI